MEIERYEVLSQTAGSPCSEVILSKATDIRIKVYHLQQDAFKPNPNELQLYADYHGEPLAFETDGFNLKKGFDMFMAVKWYARQQLDCPELLLMCSKQANADKAS